MNTQDILQIIVTMLSGLALFLFGMDTLSASLGKMTGSSMDNVIGFVTRNKYMAFLFGAGITAVVQSSSAITVLSVGLVNVGIIELEKAFGLIVGANLGTTATSWVLSLNGLSGGSLIRYLLKPSTFSPFVAIVGVGIRMFGKSDKAKTIGSAMLGFAVMMIGMNLMSQGVSPLKEVPAMETALLGFSNPVWGFVFAVFFTMLMQSSDATIGIVQAFAISIGITFGSAIPLICGAQVGTCITAILSAIGSSNNGKRTALMNLYYNLFKNIPFMLGFYLINSIVHFTFLDEKTGIIGIPLVHTLINVLGTVLFLPASKLIVNLVERSIPMSREELEKRENTLTILDPLLYATPSIALKQADNAVSILADTVYQEFLQANDIFQEAEIYEKICILHAKARSYHEQIEKYLKGISVKNTTEADLNYLTMLMNTNLAFGRLAEITADFEKRSFEKKNDPFILKLTGREELVKEERLFMSALCEIIEMTITGFNTKEPELSFTVQLCREEISEMAAQISHRRIQSLHEKGMYSELSSLINDILGVEERLLDCCDIVADEMIKYARLSGREKEADPGNIEKKRRLIGKLFKDKRMMLGIE